MAALLVAGDQYPPWHSVHWSQSTCDARYRQSSPGRRPAGASSSRLTQLPHSKPCFGSIKAHKCLVFLEECWKAHIVTNSTSFSLDFPNEYARLDSPIEVMKPKT